MGCASCSAGAGIWFSGVAWVLFPGVVESGVLDAGCDEAVAVGKGGSDGVHSRARGLSGFWLVGPVGVGLPGAGVQMTGSEYAERVTVYSSLMSSLVTLCRVSSASMRALLVASFSTYAPGLFRASLTRVLRQASSVPMKWLQPS